MIMEQVAWGALALLGAGMSVLLTAYWRLGGKIDALSERVDAQGADVGRRIDAQSADLGGRIDALAGRVDAQSARIDGLSARLDAHIERRTG